MGGVAPGVQGQRSNRIASTAFLFSLNGMLTDGLRENLDDYDVCYYFTSVAA